MKRSSTGNPSVQRAAPGRLLACAMAFNLLLGVLAPLPSLAAHAQPEPELDTDALVKPLVNTNALPPLEGQVSQQGTIPVNDSGPAPSKTLVLTGKVQTLQQAMESEKDYVDWYAWYLSARAYLGQSGGIRCPLGTPIKFHKNGLIEAMSFDPYCMASLSGRRFALPRNTKLEALILPVRPGQGPPASPEEINSRVKSLQFR